jgi:hydrogenase nickel incorporation protein HypA/HybF
MHELGIAQNILEIVQQAVPEEQASAVKRIRIRAGQLSGIVPDSLQFCFSVIVRETKMKDAELEIEQIPTLSRCKDCQHQFKMEDLAFICPSCKSTNLELISGKELEVVDIELSEANDEGL